MLKTISIIGSGNIGGNLARLWGVLAYKSGLGRDIGWKVLTRK